MLVFHHLSTYIRFSPDQVAELDQIIAEKHAQMEATLRGFFPANVGDPLYKVWTEWAALGYRSWEFFRIKTFYANKISDLFGPFKKAVDELKPALNLLVLGSKQKPECQRLGAVCVQLQTPLIEAVTGYFDASLETQFSPVQDFLRNWLEGVVVHDQLSLPMIKNAKRQNRLHLLVCSVAPDSIRSWAEVGQGGIEMNDFFSEIRSTVVDSVTIMTGKIPTKKLEVLSMRDKVAEALANPPSLEQITLIQQDLSTLFKSLLDMADHGISFTRDDVGADRSEVDSGGPT